MNEPLHVLQDGIERHRCTHAELAQQIRTEVEAEFARQWSNATFCERIKLRFVMRREVARRLPKPPSWYSLYVRR